MREISDKSWNQGYNAYFDGFLKKDNPFDEKSQEEQYILWDEGWNCADADCDDY